MKERESSRARGNGERTAINRPFGGQRRDAQRDVDVRETTERQQRARNESDRADSEPNGRHSGAMSSLVRPRDAFGHP